MDNVDDYRNKVKSENDDEGRERTMSVPFGENEKKHPVCNTCTILLVELCYQRVWWFRLMREPLLLGMRLLSWWHGIDPCDYPVRTEGCYGCIRFMKESLKERSPVSRWLNDRINPAFNRIRDSIVTQEEIREAKRLAREATHDLGIEAEKEVYY
jgi:hypothetical protein